MSRQVKNKIRGLILLLVFSLNTVAGFACSLGIDMGYNKSHHPSEPKHSHEPAGHSHGATAHSHKKGHEHKHGGHKHEHKQDTPKPATAANYSNGSDDCCANDVASFIKLDKSIVANHLLQSPVFLAAFVSQFLLPQTEEPLSTVPTHSLRRSWSLPDDTDLRIVIQSFQI